MQNCCTNKLNGLAGCRNMGKTLIVFFNVGLNMRSVFDWSMNFSVTPTEGSYYDIFQFGFT